MKHVEVTATARQRAVAPGRLARAWCDPREKAGRAYWLLPGGGVEALRDHGPGAPAGAGRGVRPARPARRRAGGARRARSRRPATARGVHIVHVIYAIPLPDSLLLLPSSDPAVRDVRVVRWSAR